MMNVSIRSSEAQNAPLFLIRKKKQSVYGSFIERVLPLHQKQSPLNGTLIQIILCAKEEYLAIL